MSSPSRGSPPSTTLALRAGLARGLRRLANRLVSPAAPAARFPVPAAPSLVAQQERARSLLVEASEAMSGLMEPLPSAPPSVVEHLPSEAHDLRQALRAYTDRLERLLSRSEVERDELRDQVRRLGDEVQSLRAEVAGLRASLAAPDQPPLLAPPAEPVEINQPGGPDRHERITTGAENPEQANFSVEHQHQSDDAQTVSTAPVDAMPETNLPWPAEPATRAGQPLSVSPIQPAEAAVQPAPVDEEARLARRLFPAGTIGVTLALGPVESFAGLAALQTRLTAEANLEHVELLHYQEGEARLHLSFRQATEWPRLRAAIARAAALDAVDLRCSQEGPAVRVRLLRAVALPS